MSRKYLVNIDLNQNQLLNAQIQNLATAPSSPVTGQIYYNTTSNVLYFWNGTSWVTPSSTQITTGILSARPTASSAGANNFYYATDNHLLYESDGTNWNQVSSFGSVTAVTSYGASSTDGTSTNYARADHSHGSPSLSTNTPTAVSITASGAAGSGTTPSKDDHTHAGPGFGAVTAQTSNGASSANGTASTVAHSDHTHGTPALTSVTPTNTTSTSSTVGTGTAAAHEDHTHGLTPANFTLDTFGAPAANVAFNAKKITGLADPTSAQDAATKNYVDASAQGLNVKGSVLAATTVSITLVGAQTIDGVSVVAGNRVLVKNQSTSSQNGIYVVQTTAWTRATDQTTPAIGDFTFVESGSTQAAQGYIVTSVTGGVTWTQFSAAGEYTAGNGITITGQSIAFNPTSTGGLQAASGGASILLATNSGLGTTSSGLAVGAGTGITVSTGTVSLTNTSVTVNGTSIALGASGTVTANTTNALTLGTGLTGTSFNGSAAVTAAIDTSVVARKYSTTLSTSATSYTITHNLGTTDVIVQVYTVSDGSEVVVDNLRASTNTVTLNFSVAPTANVYRVVILG
jgi:hypothetical protein